MAINLNGIYGGRGAAPVREGGPPGPIAGAIQAKRQGPLQRLEALVRWMHRGYEHANAGDRRRGRL